MLAYPEHSVILFQTFFPPSLPGNKVALLQCHTPLSLSISLFSPEEALDSYTAGTPVPEAQPQGIGSQCTSPLLSSALGAQLAAEWASRMWSGEWGNLLFSFLSPLQMCLAFCPFHQFTEKPAKKTKHLASTRSQKRNREQRPLTSSDCDQRLKPLLNSPESSQTASGVVPFLSPSGFGVKLSVPLLPPLHTKVCPVGLAF